MFLFWLILVYKKISQKQPFTKSTLIFRSRNQFFRTPRVNLHKNDHFLFDFHISAWLNRLISRFTQICPNSLMMTSYRKCTWFWVDETHFFEFSDQFHLRKVLLDLIFTPQKNLIIKNVDQISSWNIAWNRHLGQVTSLFPKPSSTPKFAFFYPSSDCQLWKFIAQSKNFIFWCGFFCWKAMDLLFHLGW